MPKQHEEIASEIVTAWLNAIGHAPKSDSGTDSFESLKILKDTDNIIDFYNKIYLAIRKSTEF